MGITNFSDVNIKLGALAGGNPGDHTFTGIDTADAIRSVLALSFDADGDLAGATDLTSEFSISAANTINNTGGTTVSADVVNLVLWVDVDES